MTGLIADFRTEDSLEYRFEHDHGLRKHMVFEWRVIFSTLGGSTRNLTTMRIQWDGIHQNQISWVLIMFPISILNDNGGYLIAES